MAELSRINWVICPECKFRYYIGLQLLLMEGISAQCPKCHHEFEPKSNLEPRVTEVTIDDILVR